MRLRSQRQSPMKGSSTHVGLPSAAARCATLVSTEMTTSTRSHSAAVSLKSCNSALKSVKSGAFPGKEQSFE